MIFLSTFELSFAEAIQLVNRTAVFAFANQTRHFTYLKINVRFSHRCSVIFAWSIRATLRRCIYRVVPVQPRICSAVTASRNYGTTACNSCMVILVSLSLSLARFLFHLLFSCMRNGLYTPIIALASRQSQGTHNHNGAVAKRPDEDPFIKVQAGLLFDLPYRPRKKSPVVLFSSFSIKEIKEFILRTVAEAGSAAMRQYIRD